MITEEFNLTIGVLPGYFQAGHPSDDYIAKVIAVWRTEADKVFMKTDLYISANFHTTRTVYPVQWGCPIQGEPTVLVSGLRNVEFVKDADAWKKAVIEICNNVRIALNQMTAYLSFRNIDFEYLR